MDSKRPKNANLVADRIPKRKRINELDETPTKKRPRSQSLSCGEIFLAGAAYASYISNSYTSKAFFGRSKKSLDFEAFIDVMPKDFWSGEQNIRQDAHTTDWTGDRDFMKWIKAAHAAEDAAEKAIPLPLTQSMDLKHVVQHIDTAITYISNYSQEQAAPLNLSKTSMYTTLKREGANCISPLQELVARFDGDLVAARTMHERLKEHGTKEDIKLQKQIVENIEQRKGVMEKLGGVLSGPELGEG